VAIRARRATYDLPFGNIERPTHRNTTWEQAKFEVCGHKWADLSESNYGVALLNDCKYGYDVHENVLRLSLIRSPVRPDSRSDIGTHEFTYSLLPHAGNWRHAQVDRRAYELNVPVLSQTLASVKRAASPSLPNKWSLLTFDTPGLIVEALKQAEDGDGLILRTFDNHGNHVKSKMTFARSLGRAAETNLLEREARFLEIEEENSLEVTYTPYEIKTHRLNFD
jgi:alpha-mannosidase